MPYCPNGHGNISSRFCPHCGAETVSVPPAAGDTVRVRSHDIDISVGGAPASLKCPICGRRNPETETFDCRGECGRESLCVRHLDDEYNVCADCAAERRRIAGQSRAPQMPAVTPRPASRAPRAPDFRAALRRAFEQARGQPFVDVNAGDLHRQVGGYPGPNQRMPNCCSVMRQAMQEGDTIRATPPKGAGASLTIRYRLPRTGEMGTKR
jgi:sarcosine oxidase delta subunit